MNKQPRNAGIIRYGFVILGVLMCFQFIYMAVIIEPYPTVISPSFARPDIRKDIAPVMQRYIIVSSGQSTDTVDAVDIMDKLNRPNSHKMFDLTYFPELVLKKRSPLHSIVVKVGGEELINSLYANRIVFPDEEKVDRIHKWTTDRIVDLGLSVNPSTRITAMRELLKVRSSDGQVLSSEVTHESRIQ